MIENTYLGFTLSGKQTVMYLNHAVFQGFTTLLLTVCMKQENVKWCFIYPFLKNKLVAKSKASRRHWSPKIIFYRILDIWGKVINLCIIAIFSKVTSLLLKAFLPSPSSRTHQAEPNNITQILHWLPLWGTLDLETYKQYSDNWTISLGFVKKGLLSLEGGTPLSGWNSIEKESIF